MILGKNFLQQLVIWVSLFPNFWLNSTLLYLVSSKIFFFYKIRYYKQFLRQKMFSKAETSSSTFGRHSLRREEKLILVIFGKKVFTGGRKIWPYHLLCCPCRVIFSSREASANSIGDLHVLVIAELCICHFSCCFYWQYYYTDFSILCPDIITSSSAWLPRPGRHLLLFCKHKSISLNNLSPSPLSVTWKTLLSLSI